MDLNKTEKYSLVLGAHGENAVKFLINVQKTQVFAFPLNFCAKSSSGDLSAVSASRDIPPESVPYSGPFPLPPGQYMRIPFLPVLPEVLGLYFCVPSCVSGATEYLIRSTVIHV